MVFKNTELVVIIIELENKTAQLCPTNGVR